MNDYIIKINEKEYVIPKEVLGEFEKLLALVVKLGYDGKYYVDYDSLKNLMDLIRCGK